MALIPFDENFAIDGLRVEQLYRRAPQKTVVAYAYDASNKLRADEFLDHEASSNPPARTSGALSRLYHLFNIIADGGEIHNEESLRLIAGDIWGFRADPIRICAFKHQSMWFLTHGFKTRMKRWPRAQIRLAQKIRDSQILQLGRSIHEQQLD